MAFHANLWYGVLLQGGRAYEQRPEKILLQILHATAYGRVWAGNWNLHQQLIERLEKPERKLVLRIMDAQNLIAEERSMHSFLCGFQLAWELAYELNHFETDRHPFPEEAERDAWFL